jgi:hypothetical protein
MKKYVVTVILYADGQIRQTLLAGFYKRSQAAITS